MGYAECDRSGRQHSADHIPVAALLQLVTRRRFRAEGRIAAFATYCAEWESSNIRRNAASPIAHLNLKSMRIAFLFLVLAILEKDFFADTCLVSHRIY